MSKIIHTSDIIFPSQATNFSETLQSLKRSTLSITNRLRSIEEDSNYVCSVAEAYGLPLVANERCGSWYIPLELKAASAYFKSTDGHTSQWSFSLRRLNTQVFDVVAKHNGCIIVDSTRRGKRMPDALSKTVPIWCAVINRAFWPDLPEAHELFTPPQVVSRSEHAQIEQRLDGFVKQLLELGLPISNLEQVLKKPLRPIWVTQESSLPSTMPSFPGFHTLVLCTASRRVPGGEVSEGGYVQGAGDDSEGWAQGLTAPLYWENKVLLSETPETDLPTVISELVANVIAPQAGVSAILIAPTTGLYISSLESVIATEQEYNEFDAVIHCGPSESTELSSVLKGKYLHLSCASGKLGSRDLRRELLKLGEYFVTKPPVKKVLSLCSNGTDLSAGVALAILCRYSKDDGAIETHNPQSKIDKALIRQKLSWIMTSKPNASPSRATLQSVNAYLMSDAPPKESFIGMPAKESVTNAKKIFDALSGTWKVNRQIDSRLDTLPSGSFSGTSQFTSKTPGASSFTNEYLYSEEGTFTSLTGLTFQAKRKYIWRYSTANDKLTVWFANNDSDKAEGLFHEIQFPQSQEPTQHSGKLPHDADGHHFCDPDTYVVHYDFKVEETALAGFTIRYNVTGPKKDYVSKASYTKS